MECDNNGTNNAATPVAHPTIANATLIGNGGDAQGVRLRAGTQVELYNTIITGKGKPLTVETNETENALKMVLQNWSMLLSVVNCHLSRESIQMQTLLRLLAI